MKKIGLVVKWITLFVIPIGLVLLFKSFDFSLDKDLILPVVLIVVLLAAIVGLLYSRKSTTNQNKSAPQNPQGNGAPAPQTPNQNKLKVFWGNHKLSVIGVITTLAIFSGLLFFFSEQGYSSGTVFIALIVFAVLFLGGLFAASRFSPTVRDRGINFVVWLTIGGIVFGIGAYVFRPNNHTVTPSKELTFEKEFVVTLEPGAVTKKIKAQGSETFWELHPGLVMTNSNTKGWKTLENGERRNDKAAWYQWKNTTSKPITFRYWFE